MNRVVVIINYRALADHIDTAMHEISKLIAIVQSVEPDCGGITMIRSTSDPSRITLIEYWPSQEIYSGPHMQQPHIQSFMQSARGFLAGPPDISFWDRVSGT